MKKKALLLYSWIILSVVVQAFAYLVVDKVYLGNRKSVVVNPKVVPVTPSSQTPASTEAPEVSIPLPAGAANVKVSTDGTYAAYLLDRKLHIMDIAAKQTKKVIENYFVAKENPQYKTEANITCFQWIPFAGKNMIMYGMSSLPGAPGRVQVFSYDAEIENEHIGATLYENYVPRGGEMTDIVISPLTMVHYLRVKINAAQERLFRIDIQDALSPSVTVNTAAATKIGYYSEDLFYEDGDGKLYTKSGLKNPVTVPVGFRSTLIGVIGGGQEGKDKVYIGQLTEDGKVDKVYYGLQGADMASWKSISLSVPLPAKDLMVREEGTLYSVNHSEGTLQDLQSGKKFTFTGKLIDVLNGHILYIDNDCLKFKPIKKP